jgi:adenylate cyclase class IV
MIEIELKFELPPGAKSQFKKHFPMMRLVRCLRNSDIYYDTPEFDLLRQAVFVRVRNQRRLEFKFNEQAAPAHIQSTERSFSLRPSPSQAQEMHALFSRFLPHWRAAASVEEALYRNGMTELARIENQRTQYSYGGLIICMDQVEGLGEFLEIEIQCEDGSNTQPAVARIQNLAAGFAAQPVRVGYVELWLREHHPRVYRLGKYYA